MQAHLAPRDYTPGAGLPGDRGAHQAARQAFLSLKRSFLEALEAMGGAEWLRRQVLAADEPVDLLLLRAPVLAALSGVETAQREQRQLLRRSLDSMFPDLDPPSGFAPL